MHTDSPATQTLELAPAAGAGIGKRVADALLSDPDFIPAMKEAASGALKATTRRWDKDSDGWIVEPDYKVRLAAWLGILAHMEGDPVKRVIHAHTGAGGVDLEATLDESPALQAAVERALQKSQWRHSGRQAHKAPKQVSSEVVDAT